MIKSRFHSLANTSQTREKISIDSSTNKSLLNPHIYQNPLEFDEEFQVILSDMNRKIDMTETRKKIEDHGDKLFEELYRRQQLNDDDARYEYIKLRQCYIFIFDNKDDD